MGTIIWTQADIDTLKAAIATGTLMVTYAGPPMRQVQYQNLREMRDLLAEMVGQVSGRRTSRKVQFKQGFRSGCE